MTASVEDITLAGEGRPVPGPSLGAQAVWLLAAKTLGFVLALALPLVLVRRMSQEEFGLYKQVFLIVGTAITVLPLGFGMSAFYFLPRERARQHSIVVNIVLFHVAIGLLVASVLVLRPDVLVWIFNSPDLARHARPAAVVVLLWTVGSFLEIVTVALQDVRASTGFIVISQFSKTLLLLLAAVLVGTVDALIVAAIVQGVVQIGMMLGYLQTRFPGFIRAFDARLLWRQASYALPLGGSSLLLKLQDDVHHAFVSHAFGPAAYAVYAIGVFKLPLVGILRESVGSVVLPRINQLETANAGHGILQLVADAARRLSLVYLPLYGLLMVVGREVIAVLFTPRYLDSWPVFAVSLTVVPFGIIVLDPVTRAHGERFVFLRVRAAIFCVLVVVLWLYAARLGLQGVVTAVVAAYLTGWTFAVWRMARLLRMRPADLARFGEVARIATIVLAAAVLTAWARSLLAGSPPWRVLLLTGPLFASIYVAGILVARVLRLEELRQLWRELLRSVALPPQPSAGPSVRGRGTPAPAGPSEPRLAGERR